MTPLDTLSVFCGVGGLDLGGQAAGLHIRLATDIDTGALQLLSAGTSVRTVGGDLEALLEGELADAWGADRPEMLIGGPPCTGFSHAGFWISDKLAGRDPATALVRTFAKTVHAFKPEAFVLENVPGLAFKTHRASLQDFLDRVHRSGYSTWTGILDASHFGVAQARRRLFVVGVRSRARLELGPWPLFPQRSAAWAIGQLGDLPPEPDELPGSKYRHLLALVPPGGNYLVFTRERSNGVTEALFKNRGRYWSFLLKIDPSRPSPTVPAQRLTYNGPFHWSNRHLRVREIARLQSFPDWYPVSGSLAIARRHLGNAVPPLLAAAVLWRVRTVIEGPTVPMPRLLEVSLDQARSFEDVASAYPCPNPSLKAVA